MCKVMRIILFIKRISLTTLVCVLLFSADNNYIWLEKYLLWSSSKEQRERERERVERELRESWERERDSDICKTQGHE